MKPTDEKLEELEAAHSKIFLMPVGSDDDAPTLEDKPDGSPGCDHVIALRRPTKPEWTLYQQALTAAALNDKSSAAAKIRPSQDLVLRCTVWPDKAGQTAIYDEYPGAEAVVYAQLQQLGSGGGADLAKKYSRGTKSSEPAAT